MIIALDYDKTYTADKRMWDKFILLCQQHRHKVVCLTMRRDCIEEQIKDLPSKIQIYYTNRKAKKKWAEQNGIAVDIWIDDKPAWILEDAFSG